jgi:phosphopantetheinyl transferase
VLDIAPDAPTLWLLDIDDAATRCRAEAVAPLPQEAALFAARCDAGRRWLRRRLARLLLAAAGSCRPDRVVIERSAAGAPVVVTPAGWYLSVAGRWRHCLVGIAPLPLGVDLERIERDQPVPPDLLTGAEREALALTAGGDRPRFFARAWAAKESHAKWTGAPRAVEPAVVETGVAFVRSPWGTTRCWSVEVGEFVAAACGGHREER